MGCCTTELLVLICTGHLILSDCGMKCASEDSIKRQSCGTGMVLASSHFRPNIRKMADHKHRGRQRRKFVLTENAFTTVEMSRREFSPLIHAENQHFMSRLLENMVELFPTMSISVIIFVVQAYSGRLDLLMSQLRAISGLEPYHQLEGYGRNLSRMHEISLPPMSVLHWQVMDSNPWLRPYPLLTPECVEAAAKFLAENYSGKYCWATSFDPEFVATVMAAGFLPVAESTTEGPVPYLLIPKLHQQRCILRFENLRVQRSVRRRCGRFWITCNACFEEVIAGCLRQHGENWLFPPMVDVLRRIHAAPAGIRGVRVHTFEVWMPRRLAAAARPPGGAARNQTRLPVDQLPVLSDYLARSAAGGGSNSNRSVTKAAKLLRRMSASDAAARGGGSIPAKAAAVCIGDDAVGAAATTTIAGRALATADSDTTDRVRVFPADRDAEGAAGKVGDGEAAGGGLKEEEGDDDGDELVLVGGEVGYSVGSCYTSLSGFTEADSAGSVQCVCAARLLQLAGARVWDLGMAIDYKVRLGAAAVARRQFLHELDVLRRDLPVVLPRGCVHAPLLAHVPAPSAACAAPPAAAPPSLRPAAAVEAVRVRRRESADKDCETRGVEAAAGCCEER